MELSLIIPIFITDTHRYYDYLVSNYLASILQVELYVALTGKVYCFTSLLYETAIWKMENYISEWQQTLSFSCYFEEKIHHLTRVKSGKELSSNHPNINITQDLFMQETFVKHVFPKRATNSWTCCLYVRLLKDIFNYCTPMPFDLLMAKLVRVFLP